MRTPMQALRRAAVAACMVAVAMATAQEAERQGTDTPGPTDGNAWRVPGLGMEMVWVGPGAFEACLRIVNLRAAVPEMVPVPHGYWLGRYEVTQGEWQALMGKTLAQQREAARAVGPEWPLAGEGPRYPMYYVSWYDATAFCQKLTQRERAAGRIPAGYQYRLPTQAEWEYAARGGPAEEGYPYSGSYNPEEVAWGRSNSDYQTHPVGLKKPNELGCYDMSGNVQEWCLDRYSPAPRDDRLAPRRPPRRPVATLRALRGGGWFCGPGLLPEYPLNSDMAASKAQDRGFRVCLAMQVGADECAGEGGPAEGKDWTVPGTDIDLVWVAPGSLLMGCAEGDQQERPVHEEVIPRGYWLGRYEVTQASYEALTGTNPSHFLGARCPVEGVSWYDAMTLCADITERESAVGRLPAGYEYRLPTEAEWEYAARGGARSLGFTFAGSNNPDEVAWYYGNSGDRPLDDSGPDWDSKLRGNNSRTHPVGQKKPNELGLYDMSGNVWEWCLNLYHPNYDGSPAPDPWSVEGVRPISYRGGSWRDSARRARATYRYRYGPDGLGGILGFRVCLAPCIDGLSSGAALVSVPAKPETAPAATPAVAGAAPVPGQPWTVPDLGVELVWVAPGSFQMGTTSPWVHAEAKPVHEVRISRGYWLGKCEVTQGEYEAVMGRNPSAFRDPQNPVETVSWDDAVTFCTKLTEREQKAGRLPDSYEYRLPTEAEWEYAARGGPKSQAASAGSGEGFLYSGSSAIDEVAWYYGNSGDRLLDDGEKDPDKRAGKLSSNKCRPHPVGTKKPNELGLHDMTGNVWEWCLDWFDGSYYAKSPGTDPVNVQVGSQHVMRGSFWGHDAGSCEVTVRAAYVNPVNDLGFRVCLVPQSAGR